MTPTPTQIREVLDHLEKEGYVLCKDEPYTKCVFYDEVGLEHEINFPHPLYSAAPPYEPKEGV